MSDLPKAKCRYYFNPESDIKQRTTVNGSYYIKAADRSDVELALGLANDILITQGNYGRSYAELMLPGDIVSADLVGLIKVLEPYTGVIPLFIDRHPDDRDNEDWIRQTLLRTKRVNGWLNILGLIPDEIYAPYKAGHQHNVKKGPLEIFGLNVFKSFYVQDPDSARTVEQPYRYIPNSIGNIERHGRVISFPLNYAYMSFDEGIPDNP